MSYLDCTTEKLGSESHSFLYISPQKITDVGQTSATCMLKQAHFEFIDFIQPLFNQETLTEILKRSSSIISFVLRLKFILQNITV